MRKTWSDTSGLRSFQVLDGRLRAQDRMRMEPVSGRLLIRADASTLIGAGHVMRCLALAQAWRDRAGDVVLASAVANHALEQRFRSECIELETLSVEPGSDADAAATAALVLSSEACWTVLDGYHFGERFQSIVCASSRRVLVLADYMHSPRFHCAVLLNQNIHANQVECQQAAQGAKVLLGNRFTLLRREFWPWRGNRRRHSGLVRRILVSLGGGDADNVTAKVLHGLDNLADLRIEVIVVVGANNPHWKSLERQQAGSAVPMFLMRNTPNMPALLSECDVVVCGGGTICWEAAFVGTPVLAVILADNQEPIARSLDTAGVAINLGWHDKVGSVQVERAVRQLAHDAPHLHRMSELGQQLIDGWGVERVLDEMLSPQQVFGGSLP